MRTHSLWTLTSSLAATAAAASLATAVLAACSSGHPAARPPARSSPATSPVAVSCTSQFRAWAGRNDRTLRAVGRDLGKAGNAATAGNLGATQAATERLAADARAGLADPPPGCVPGLRAPFITAMHDFTAAAADASRDDLGTASMLTTAGGQAAARATKAITRWEQQS